MSTLILPFTPTLLSFSLTFNLQPTFHIDVHLIIVLGVAATRTSGVTPTLATSVVAETPPPGRNRRPRLRS